jgi:anthranilate phosphoribosyltransferase
VGAITRDSPVPREGPIAREGPVARKGPIARDSPVPGEGPIAREGPVPGEGPIAREGPVPGEGPIAREGPMTRDTILTNSIELLAERRDLTFDQAAAALGEIMSGNASEVQIAAFLIALRTKGETVEEVAGLAQTMRSFAARVQASRDNLLDTAGTGGGRRTFNVSTTAALIAAGAGCVVAKHGNRSATGLSGSADLLEALGARIDLGPAQVARCIDEVGFGFMFAPAHHQATRYVVPVRRELAVRTIFNLLGPLTNPAGATRQLIGVADPRYVELMAGALVRLGTAHAMVVSSQDGLDELSICAPTTVCEVVDGELRRHTVSPEDVSLARAAPEAIPGGDPAENADIARRIFQGELGPPRDLAVLNAGAAIYVGGGAPSLAEGVQAAQRAIDSGAVASTVERFLAATHAGESV